MYFNINNGSTPPRMTSQMYSYGMDHSRHYNAHFEDNIPDVIKEPLLSIIKNGSYPSTKRQSKLRRGEGIYPMMTRHVLYLIFMRESGICAGKEIKLAIIHWPDDRFIETDWTRDEVNNLLNTELLILPVHCPYDWEKEQSALKTLLSDIEARSIAQAKEVETLEREVQERLQAKQEKEKKELELQLSNLKCSPSSSSEESDQQPLQQKRGHTSQRGRAPHSSIPSFSYKNYSEFEAAADPFESAELQTINELHELAACFSSVPQTPPKCYFPQPLNNHQLFQQNYVSHPQHQELKKFKKFRRHCGRDQKGRKSSPEPLYTLNKEELDPFADLSETERSVCSKINEMGFAKPQLLVSERNCPKEVAEDVLLKKDLDKEESRKYLTTFMELKELGFESSEMCKAIEEAGYNKDEALKVLIKD
ncbi:unnamed protein product [Lepeophtheirus salmonis]|uniref:(salmon louse) hypothetical protein n=1 Tax=Lepeophtheirus salmonis TaxID=72036 RepID=A0A7R8CQU5_LEPSM|nr:unnamed protein product [Lepeophtheirus salmonis]CAF2896616.1 unnamed protein product [Lepeophtheirus salmonis]